MSINTICENVFSLKHPQFKILEQVAKNGEIFKHEIVIGAYSKRHVSRLIDTLVDHAFLKITKKIPHQNYKNKFLYKVGLTLKGIFASLYFVDLKDIYLIKFYLNTINDSKTRHAILDYIDADVKLFLFVTNIMGISFKKVSLIHIWIENYESLPFFSRKNKKLISLEQSKLKSALSVDRLPFNLINSKLERLLIINYDLWSVIVDMFSNKHASRYILKRLEKYGDKSISNNDDFMTVIP